jgi:hypothetical protein
MEMNITPLSSAHYYKTYVWLVEEGDEREREVVCLVEEGTRHMYYITSYPSILRCKMLELLAMEETLVYIRCLGH